MEYLNGYAEQYKDWSDCFPAGLDCHVARAAAHDRQALRALNPQVIRGSLIHGTRGVANRAAVCDRTRAWPKYYLSVSRAGKRPHLIYISQATVAQVREQLAHLRNFARSWRSCAILPASY